MINHPFGKMLTALVVLMLWFVLSCGRDGFIDSYDYTGWENRAADTLHYAATTGNIETAKEILEEADRFSSNIDANVRNKDNSTPLISAAVGGDIRMGEWLIDKGAYVNVINDYGESPLSKALFLGNEAFAEMLVRHGANVNIQDQSGCSILYKAAAYEVSRQGRPEVVSWLIEHDACVDIATSEGMTPLHRAACFGNDAILQQLLMAGAKIELCDSENRTALDYAIEQKQANVVTILTKEVRRPE